MAQGHCSCSSEGQWREDCIEIEEWSLTVVLAEEEEGACEHQKQLSASGAEPQAASVTALSAFTSPPLGKYCTAQQTNYGPWLVTAYSYFLKLPIFISFLFSYSPASYHITGKIHFQYQINSNCQGCIAEPLFHTFLVLFLL